MLQYLFDRTQGQIGSLMNLLRQGAILAIDRDEERLTEELLEQIQLSYFAESARPKRSSPTGGTKRKTAGQKPTSRPDPPARPADATSASNNGRGDLG
jgi:hypothetical protein